MREREAEFGALCRLDEAAIQPFQLCAALLGDLRDLVVGEGRRGYFRGGGVHERSKVEAGDVVNGTAPRALGAAGKFSSCLSIFSSIRRTSALLMASISASLSGKWRDAVATPTPARVAMARMDTPGPSLMGSSRAALTIALLLSVASCCSACIMTNETLCSISVSKNTVLHVEVGQ